MRFVKFPLLIAFLISFSISSQAQILKFDKQGFRVVDGQGKTLLGGLTNDDIIRGLKEALNVGIKNATNLVTVPGGYFNNAQIKIPFPPEAQKIKDAAINMGMDQQVADFERSLNSAAEEAAKVAVSVFISAIQDMKVDDGMKILKGKENEATLYLKAKTSSTLRAKYKPIVQAAIDKVQVTKYWTPLAQAYNSIPFGQKINPNLTDYTTDKALDGLFYMVGLEEAKIRKNPAARVNDILKKVFAGAENPSGPNAPTPAVPAGGVKTHQMN